ncbi:MAG: MtnX-like HAD-IB family phosphatase [Deltaproteobacteria bacterium]|nr:MtnX-like HAD-IB family phosphatase [Deltaproteobacteria bacterium]
MTSITRDHLAPASGPAGDSPCKRLLVVCDFDGTVCRVDLCNEILDHFAGDWEAIDRAYAAGEVGSRAAYGRIAPLIRTNRPQVMDFILKHERLDPFFKGFVDFCRRRRIDLKIVSDGLDACVEATLRKHGLDLEYFCNRLLFMPDDRIEFDFPPASPECGRCGTCKRSLLDRFRPDYDRIIYVGDGHSDLCAAGMADQIFAKDVLYEKCMEKGTPCIFYDDFDDIRSRLEKTFFNP